MPQVQQHSIASPINSLKYISYGTRPGPGAVKKTGMPVKSNVGYEASMVNFLSVIFKSFRDA